MTSKQRFTGLALVVVLVAAIAFGASSVLAQNDGNTPPTPYPPGTPGYGWNMHGMMWDSWQGDTMWTAVADNLGIDVNTLLTELQSGKTLAQIAEEQGFDIQVVYDAALTTMTGHMNALVESGYITQVQADTQLTWMRDNIAQMPMFNGTGFDQYPMGGMMGGYGQGIMGYGMHSGWMGQHHDGWTGTRYGGCH